MTAAWTELGRTQAVAFALLERDESTLDELVAFLQLRGRDDPKHLVSAALAALKKSGRAHSVGHGRWAPGAGSAERHGPTAPTAPRPARGSGDEFHEYWDCSKGCDHVYDSPRPARAVHHTRCQKARYGDWVPMIKRSA